MSPNRPKLVRAQQAGAFAGITPSMALQSTSIPEVVYPALPEQPLSKIVHRRMSGLNRSQHAFDLRSIFQFAGSDAFSQLAQLFFHNGRDAVPHRGFFRLARATCCTSTSGRICSHCHPATQTASASRTACPPDTVRPFLNRRIKI